MPRVTPTGMSTFSWGLDMALKRAGTVTSAKSVFGEGIKNAVDMVFGVLPVVMGLGTVALVIAEYTTVFEVLGTPFIPYLELIRCSRGCGSVEDDCCWFC